MMHIYINPLPIAPVLPSIDRFVYEDNTGTSRIKQHLSNIWSLIQEKGKQKVVAALKKKRCL